LNQEFGEFAIGTFSKEGKEDIAGHNKERKVLMKVREKFRVILPGLEI
jgi:hypothetical protein